MIEVSAGIVFDGAGRILICRRGEGRRNAHLWEFPGGKIEAGESPEECLVRELQEELALPVEVRGVRCTGEAQGIRFHFIDAFTGVQPVPAEHEAVRFVTRPELLQYDFCPADLPVARQLAFSGVRHFIWDFDGTLLDTYPAMVRAFVAAAGDFGIAVSPEHTLSLMKNCLTHCCEVIGAENGISAKALEAAFRRHEQGELALGLPPVADVPEVLEALARRGGRHYVATHRDLQCRELLDRAGLLDRFSGFVTREDGLPRKPAPDMLLHLMDRCGFGPEAAVMIGDRPLDTQAGRRAGMRSILLDPENRFSDQDADVRVTRLGELLAWLTVDECAVL